MKELKEIVNGYNISIFIPDYVEQHERKRLLKYMSNWSYLSMYLSANDPPMEEIGKLIRIELGGKQREDILNRLAGRYVSKFRERFKAAVMELTCVSQ